MHSCSAKGSGLFGRYRALRAGGCPNTKNYNFKIRIFEEVGCDDHCTLVVATELPRSLQKFIFVCAENFSEIILLSPNIVYIDARSLPESVQNSIEVTYIYENESAFV